MEAGVRVKFTELFLNRRSKHSLYLKHECWEGTVVRLSGKNDCITHVKWDGFKTTQSYHCNFIQRIENK